jgi:hypothetical protein
MDINSLMITLSYNLNFLLYLYYFLYLLHELHSFNYERANIFWILVNSMEVNQYVEVKTKVFQEITTLV